MTKIILILAALATAAGAYFGWQNKTHYESTHTEVIDLRSKLNDLQAKNTATLQKLEEAKTARTKAESAKDEAEIRKTLAERNLTKRTEAIEDAQTDLDGVREEMLKITTVLEEIDVPDIETLESQVEEFTQQKADLTQRAAELELLVAQARQGVKDATEVVKSNAETERVRNSLYGLKQRKATIDAVDPEWNFVVINLGNTTGIQVNDRAVVERNGRRVGLLVVRNVENQRVVADIVSDSVNGTVLPGDSVVFNVSNREQS